MGTTKKKKGRKMMGVAVLALVIVAGALFLLNGDSQATETFAQEVAVSGSITSYYSFTGYVKVKSSQNITATAPATVREVYVIEGEHVGKNDRLLRTSDGITIKAGVSGEVDKLHVAKDDDIQIKKSSFECTLTKIKRCIPSASTLTERACKSLIWKRAAGNPGWNPRLTSPRGAGGTPRLRK